MNIVQHEFVPLGRNLQITLRTRPVRCRTHKTRHFQKIHHTGMRLLMRPLANQKMQHGIPSFLRKRLQLLKGRCAIGVGIRNLRLLLPNQRDLFRCYLGIRRRSKGHQRRFNRGMEVWFETDLRLTVGVEEFGGERGDESSSWWSRTLSRRSRRYRTPATTNIS